MSSQAEEDHDGNDYPMTPVSSISNDASSPSITTADERAPWRAILKNRLFWTQIIVFVTATFVLCLSTLYTISLTLSLKLDDYFCDEVTIDAIRQHSIANNLTYGAYDQCWDISDTVVSDQKLWSRQSYTYSTGNLRDEPSAVLPFVIFLITTLILFVLIMYYIVHFIIDIARYRNNTLGLSSNTASSNTSSSASTSCSDTCTCACFWKTLLSYMYKIYDWYAKTFQLDSLNWILLKLSGEIAETVLQTNALWVYNGTALFSRSTLAFDSKYVIWFAVLLFVNCICVGIVWLFYAWKPRICHGVVFLIFFEITDVICEVLYVVFPIMVIWDENANNSNGEYDNFNVSLASLELHDPAKFAATWIPTLFLIYKFYSLSWESQLAMTEHFKSERTLHSNSPAGVQMTEHNENRGIRSIRASFAAVAAVLASSTSTTNWTISEQKSETEANGCKYYLNHRNTRKSVISAIALVFIIYGGGILSFVLSHFQSANEYCYKLVDQSSAYYNNEPVSVDYDLFIERPDLYFYDNCTFPVFPFDTICDCRTFDYHYSEDADSRPLRWRNVTDLNLVFNISLMDAFQNLMREFRMLQKLRISGLRHAVNELDAVGLDAYFNVTAEMFASKQMQVFILSELPTDYIDAEIANLQSLEYFKLYDVYIRQLPPSFSTLTNLQYFRWTPLFPAAEIKSLPDLCSLHNLRGLHLDHSSVITEIPHCITNLDELEVVWIQAFQRLVGFPIDIFGLSELRLLNLELTFDLTFDTMLNYSNITDLSQYKFDYADSARYALSDSGLCEEFEFGNPRKPFQSFFNTFPTVCELPCAASYADRVDCIQSAWQNGICDPGCNRAACTYDGGDCIQTCDVDNYAELLVNGICDPEMNKTACNYDQCDCLQNSEYHPISMQCEKWTYNASLCAETYAAGNHSCNPEWVGDSWCDSECVDAGEWCAFDGFDCAEGGCYANSNCAPIWTIFSAVVSVNGTDNKVSANELCDESTEIYIQQLVPEFTTSDLWCTLLVQFYDADGDGLLSMSELVAAFPDELGIDQEKAEQLDCSACLPDPSEY